ncbi:ATP-binding protein [Kitasatospora sp. NA04385]|uniref:ATP-binding protein n=1 Tax=Kitasatospora sp. NA04385 TaxID=2742135 RepID=UPI001591E94B|nr:ATP-binding protein [Kitasatospora sp. NA04385]QKW19065.1 ATP-binding protein [Kitasatospora sp. NA04385]
MDGQARFPRQRSASWREGAEHQGSAHGAPAAYQPGCALHRRLHAALDAADLPAVGAIRRRLRTALDHWGVPEELADTAELLASELVTNALVHTGRGAVFDAVLTEESRLRVEVQDGAVQVPSRRAASDTATSGRGLFLVEALADDWGVQLRADGKTTWFELSAA